MNSIQYMCITQLRWYRDSASMKVKTYWGRRFLLPCVLRGDGKCDVTNSLVISSSSSMSVKGNYDSLSIIRTSLYLGMLTLLYIVTGVQADITWKGRSWLFINSSKNIWWFMYKEVTG